MDTVRKGKRIVVAIIVVLLAVDVCFSLYTINAYRALEDTAQGNQSLIQDVIRFALTCLLCFFLYKKHNWARWTFIVLTGIAGLGMLVLFFSRYSMFLFPPAAIYLVCGGLLLFNRSVKAFFKKGKQPAEMITPETKAIPPEGNEFKEPPH